MSSQKAKAPEDCVDQEWRPIEAVSGKPNLHDVGFVEDRHAEIVAHKHQGPTRCDDSAP